MYRQYENPCNVEEMLKSARKEYAEAKQSDPENVDRLIDLANEVASLEERLNFAWQDDEAEAEGYDY